jgi:hypothetical protein
VIIYLGTLVFVNREAIFYKSKSKNNVENRIEDKKRRFDVISRAEKIEGVRQRTVPLSVVDQTVFTYKPSFESQVTKKIYDFLAGLDDKSEKWVLYTYNNEMLNGYIYPSLKGFSPTKKLSEYNIENKPMNVILVFKEYMSYVEPIDYLNRLGNSKYFIPTMDDKHDSVFKSGCDFDVSKDVNDIFVSDVRDIDTLEGVEFQRAYFKIRSLKDFLKVREMCGSKYDIHYDSASVIHVENIMYTK